MIPARCPVCGSSEVEQLLHIESAPALCNALWPSTAEALDAPAGPIDLSLCVACSHVWNPSFDADLVAYSPAYDNSLHFSAKFQKYAADLADHLIATYSVRGRQIVEIGSGSGDFLRLLCERGDNTGLGYDPSHDPANAPEDPRITIEAEMFPPTLDARAGLVICQHVLEHVEAPAALLDTVAESVRGRDDVAVYFEMPDADYMFDTPAVWDLIYEHVGYFGRASLGLLFERAGLEVYRTGRSFGDQYLWIEAGGTPLGAVSTDQGAHDRSVTRTVESAREFARTFSDVIDHWTNRLGDLAEAGPVAIWGAGSKGVQFLNLADPSGAVTAVVDINPRKAGKFVPRTGQPVVSPDALVDARPATVLVMNPLYRTEIARQLSALGIDAGVEVV
jgi:hypothetical protein